MKKTLHYLIIILFSSIFIISCEKKDEEEEIIPETPLYPSMLIIVENSIYNDIESKLNTYINDIGTSDTTALVIKWESGSVNALRDTLKKYYDEYQIKGAFLIGDLPVAWYEMDGPDNFDKYEEFPCDLYLMDPDAGFTDADANGKYESHSTLNLKIGVGRIIGSNSEIKSYLDRVNNYKNNGSLVNESVYIFVDDDWEPDYLNYWEVNTTGLYSQTDLCIDINETSKTNYINKLTNQGAEYVHQMIHSYPSSLAIHYQGASEYINTNDIKNYNFKASFFNMFNCSGARYTEDNLGMTNVLGTSYGLAIMGTTKTGGNYSPNNFHSALANDYNWGKSFCYWYNNTSITEEWSMGLCLLGDPMITISENTKSALININFPEPNAEQLENLYKTAIQDAKNAKVESYEDFIIKHPKYYK